MDLLTNNTPDVQTRMNLERRNEHILRAILRKAEALCPDAIDLIGIAGSFHSGDIHGKSDLDLCIVINNDSAWKIASCFILENVAHDVYCTPWAKLEAMAAYTDPYVTKLLELNIAYCRDDASMQRYMALRHDVGARLSAPFTNEDCDKAESHVGKADQAYVDLLLGGDYGVCRFAAAKLLLAAEYALYLYNKAYVKRGIRRIPEELAAMPQLPADFMSLYNRLVLAGDMDAMKSAATELLKSLRNFARQKRAGVTNRREMTPADLKGTFEEIHSNWKNKMHLAAETDDAYLSLMTAASCQHFYDEMADQFLMEKLDLIKHTGPDNLHDAADAFDRAMESYRMNYDRLGADIVRYPDLEAFEGGYLGEPAVDAGSVR